MSVKQNLFVSVFVDKCLMLNDVKYTIFKMFVTLMSNYLFVISFQLTFYKTLRCSLQASILYHSTLRNDEKEMESSIQDFNAGQTLKL